MLVVIASIDRYLSGTIEQLVGAVGFRRIRSSKLERLERELKSPGKLLIIDMNWKEIQKPGELRRLVNLGRISGNKVICICPNKEEELKTLARSSGAAEVFIRYELHTAFQDYLSNL